MTAEDRMSRAFTIAMAAIVVAAICFVAGVGWIFWQIAGYVGLVS